MPFTIDHEPIHSNGQLRAMLTARQDGTAVHQDTINLASSSARQRFVRDAAARSATPAADIERALLEIADRQHQQPAAAASTREAPDDPHRLARACLERRWHTPQGCSLVHYREQFHQWDSVKYVPLGDKEFRSLIAAEVHGEFDRLASTGIADRDGCRHKTTCSLVSNVIQAIGGVVQVPDALQQPTWLAHEQPEDCEPLPPPEQMIATPAGVVDLAAFAEGRRYLYPPTPDFFTANGLDYDFNPDAGCPHWLAFLHQIWPGDQASIDLLQEFFGYVLLPDTSQQKILLLHGPKRSGRGTMMRVLRELVGESNIVGPTFSSLQNAFGLEPLLGKLVATINDARLSGRHDIPAIVETLLSVSGEDAITVNRKNRAMVTAKLSSRIIIVTNELPNLRDARGALASRLLILRLTQSWYGHEDPQLTSRLVEERAGILTWAAHGLIRLRQRGYFQQPPSATPLINEMERLSSPIQAFLTDCCEVEPTARVQRSTLYDAWCGWCEANNMKSPGSSAQFGRDLRAVMPTIEDTHFRCSSQQIWCYRGLRLRPQCSRGSVAACPPSTPAAAAASGAVALPPASVPSADYASSTSGAA